MYKIIGGDGKEYSPVSADDVRQWIAEGRVNAQTQVQAEDSADWQPLGTLPEFGLPPSAAPLAPPPSGTAPVPTFLKVISILNMVFGGLGLLCTPFNFIVIHLATKTLHQTLALSPLLKNNLIFSSVWGLIGAGLLLASGIGLWKLRPWARKLAIWYSVAAIVIGLIGIAVVLSTFGPGGGGGSEMDHAQRIGGVVGGVIGGLVGMVYNILLLVFLNKPAAKRATGEID